jgi:excisionase family DNA binding protein
VLRESASPLPAPSNGEAAPKRAYRINEVAAMLRISRRTVWRLIEKNTLASFKFRRTRLVTADSITNYQASGRGEPAPFTDESGSSSVERIAYRVDEVAALLRVTRRTVQRAIATGHLKSTKEHGARLIGADCVRALLSNADGGEDR